jgi:hypothetical protein
VVIVQAKEPSFLHPSCILAGLWQGSAEVYCFPEKGSGGWESVSSSQTISKHLLSFHSVYLQKFFSFTSLCLVHLKILFAFGKVTTTMNQFYHTFYLPFRSLLNSQTISAWQLTLEPQLLIFFFQPK